MEYTVNTLEEYLNAIEKIKIEEKNSLLWFRGHNRSYYKLQPSLLRNAIQVTNSVGTPIAFSEPNYENGHGETLVVPPINKLLENFKTLFNNKNYKKEDIGNPQNDIEWYFLEQHYGIPTTLLDWSEDPFIALFFAIYGYDENDSNVTIYIFSPNHFNKEISPGILKNPVSKPIILNQNSLSFLLEYLDNDKCPYLPICIKPNIQNYRIIRQSGNFIIHGCNFQPLDSQPFKNLFHKIYIPNSKFKYFEKILNNIQINDKTVYGFDNNLDKESRKIKEAAQKQFDKFITELYEELQPPPFSINH